MFLPMTVEALDLGNIFHFLLDGVDVSTSCRRVITTTSLALSSPKISLLVVLVFLVNLALVGRRLLMLVIRYISKRSISGLNPSGVFLLFFCGLVPLETPGIDLLGPFGWL